MTLGCTWSDLNTIGYPRPSAAGLMPTPESLVCIMLNEWLGSRNISKWTFSNTTSIPTSSKKAAVWKNPKEWCIKFQAPTENHPFRSVQDSDPMGLIPEAVVELYVRLCWRCRAPWGVCKQSPEDARSRCGLKMYRYSRYTGPGAAVDINHRKYIYIYS